jgi:protein Mpv17
MLAASAFVAVKPHSLVAAKSSSKKTPSRVAFSNSKEMLPETPAQEVAREIKTVERNVIQSAIKNEDIVLGAMVGSALGALVLHQVVDMNAVAHHAPVVLNSLKSIPLQAWNAYESALASNPVATKGATSATVYGLGDVLSQRTAGDDELDTGRVLRSMIAGGVGHGPLSHVWYNLSEGFFTNLGLASVWWSFIPKIVVDQTVWGPIWNSLYIVIIGILQAESFGKIKEDVQSNTIPLFLEGLKLWPLAHCVTYGLIPVENRLVWVDAVEILWVSILATKAASLSEAATIENTEAVAKR